jgi:hypothetical protein
MIDASVGREESRSDGLEFGQYFEDLNDVELLEGVLGSEELEFRGSVDGGGCSRSTSNDPGPEVLYVRNGVCIKPSSSEMISGKFSLIKFESEVGADTCSSFLAWFPEAEEQDASSAGGNNLEYSVHPTSISEIKSIKTWTPPLRTHTMTVVLHSGETLPTFYFRSGGLKALLSSLKSVCTLVASAQDPWTFLVHQNGDPFSLGVMSLHADHQRSSAILESISSKLLGSVGESGVQQRGDNSNTSEDGANNIRNQISDIVDAVQNFSRGARQSMKSLLSASTFNFAAGDGDPGQSVMFVGSDGLYLGIPPNLMEQKTCSKKAECTSGETGSTVSEIKKEETQSPSNSSSSGWELIERTLSNRADKWGGVTAAPLGKEELNCFMNSEGQLIGEARMKTRAFYGGASADGRYFVWRYLLGLDKVDMTSKEKEANVNERLKRYKSIKLQWRLISPEQASRFSKWKERKSRVLKDVPRTDRSHPFFAEDSSFGMQCLKNILLTYIFWNWDLGYCQGMSDIAAPIIWVVHSGLHGQMKTSLNPDELLLLESESFWMFAALLERIGPNFSSDGLGMQNQLAILRGLVKAIQPDLYEYLSDHDALNMFFCFRWILILFKREFQFDKVIRLWDSFFCQPNLHLFMCLSILIQHKTEIINLGLSFDGLLEYCINLSGKLNLESTLADAELLSNCALEAGYIT